MKRVQIDRRMYPSVEMVLEPHYDANRGKPGAALSSFIDALIDNRAEVSIGRDAGDWVEIKGMFQGLRDSEDKTRYVNDNLDERDVAMFSERHEGRDRRFRSKEAEIIGIYQQARDILIEDDARIYKRKHVLLTFSADHVTRLLDNLSAEFIRDSVGVVVDVIKFTSAVNRAFDVGKVESVVPTTSAEEAFRVRDRLEGMGKTVVVAAEKAGVMVDGADRGSSVRFRQGELRGKVLVSSTSHGTPTLKALIAKGVEPVILASVLNLDAVVKYLDDCGKKNIILATSGDMHPSSDRDKVLWGLDRWRRYDVVRKSQGDIAVAAEIACRLRDGFKAPDLQGLSEFDPETTGTFKPNNLIVGLHKRVEKTGLEGIIRDSRWARRGLALDREAGNNYHENDLNRLVRENASTTIPFWNPTVHAITIMPGKMVQTEFRWEM